MIQVTTKHRPILRRNKTDQRKQNKKYGKSPVHTKQPLNQPTNKPPKIKLLSQQRVFSYHMLKENDAQQGNQTPFPTVYAIDYPWKTPALLKLPETELNAWFDNMEAGRDLSVNDIRLKYIAGRTVHLFRMTPQTLYLPDGTKRRLPYTPDTQQPMLDPQDEIISVLQAHVKNGDIPVLELGTPRQHIENMVRRQFTLMETFGVERHGSFEDVLGTLHHRQYDTKVDVVVSFDQCIKDPEGNLYPKLFMEVNAYGAPNNQQYINYHTHAGVNNTYPSAGDVLWMESQKRTSITIGTLENPETYRITEWKLKKGLQTLMPQITTPGQRTENPYGWYQGDQLREIIDQTFDRRDYLLTRKNGHTTITETNPTN
ncbi:Uncharacterised protein [uncultured archaeon]|nr:Uncharacterised protein [uncultured archaeon]